jgi:hypothetical protein
MVKKRGRPKKSSVIKEVVKVEYTTEQPESTKLPEELDKWTMSHTIPGVKINWKET